MVLVLLLCVFPCLLAIVCAAVFVIGVLWCCCCWCATALLTCIWGVRLRLLRMCDYGKCAQVVVADVFMLMSIIVAGVFMLMLMFHVDVCDYC